MYSAPKAYVHIPMKLQGMRFCPCALHSSSCLTVFRRAYNYPVSRYSSQQLINVNCLRQTDATGTCF